MQNIIQVQNENIIASTPLPAGRRKALKEILDLTRKFALGGVPVIVGGLWSKSVGQVDPPVSAGDQINHLLLIEYMLAEFFETAASKGLPLLERSINLEAFNTIAKHDRQHIDTLLGRLIPFKARAIPKPVFDFTGGGGSGNGPFKDVFSNLAVLGEVARALKDLSVRAYISQASPFLLGGANMHPVESRHAARLRTLPFFNGLESEDPWITRNETEAKSDQLKIVYSGEENTIQRGIQIVNINGKAITVNHATEAFDEPLDMDEAKDIIRPFIASA